MTVSYPVNKKAIIFIIIVSLALHVLALLLSKGALSSWRWEQLPFHSAIEALGSFIAMLVAYLLVILEARKKGTQYNLSIAGALVGMGVIDGLHAVVPTGELFVWLHSTATLWGGILFFSIWLPRKLLKKLPLMWPLFVFVAALLFGLISIQYAHLLPKMVVDSKFSDTAVAINLLGGALLIFAAIKLLLTYRSYGRVDDLLFVLHCFMFGLAATMFEQSVLWDVSWWGWHALRFIAYGVAFWFAVTSEVISQNITMQINQQLGSEVARKESQLSRATQSLEIIHAQQNAIINNLSDAIIITDRKGIIKLFSPPAEKLFQYRADEIMGQNISCLMVKEIATDHDKYMSEYEQKEESTIIGRYRELIGQTKKGDKFPIDVTITELFVDGELHFIGSLRDITERKANEEKLHQAMKNAEQANRAKTAFLTNISHEIRTPINGIYGSLQLLKSEPISSFGIELIDKAKISTRHLLSIINDILDVSKIEAGTLNLETQQLSISHLLENIIDELKTMSDEKQIEISVLNMLSNDYRLGDPVRVRQILHNIISNAVKFTEQGHVKINISKYKTRDKSGVAIKVKDTGIGMAEDTINNLFVRFNQGDISMTRRYGGTGLGMAITEALVELMDGHIWVDSELGKGSEFIVHIPLDECEAPAREVKQEALIMNELVNKYVLVVEDNDINQAIVQAMLQMRGVRTEIAENGKIAIEMAEEKRPDLVLMDIQMPVMDGITACLKIREIYPDLPIVALTANVMSDDIAEYKRAGFNDHIGKPIEQDILHRCLNKYLH